VIDPRSTDGFPTTHWSRVLAAGDRAAPEARDALAELCAAYWFPVYAFIRRKGNDPESSLDLTQGYFARLLEGRTLAAADPGKGRFRALLRADVAFFLSDARDRAAALKRGGGIRFVPLDAEGRYAAEPAHGLTPERLFDRAWALDLLFAVVDRLREEYAAAGKLATFEALKGVLDGDPHAAPYTELACRLGTTEGAIQVASHRLRRRYRELIRGAIAATVADPSEVEDEIRALFAALG
jgi:DNA-directed RNA polymerase specialized sigma24 family protein